MSNNIQSAIDAHEAVLNAARSVQQRAGTEGRLRGHGFERILAEYVTAIGRNGIQLVGTNDDHLVVGNPASELIGYIMDREGIVQADKIEAWWTGALATSGLGDRVFGTSGINVSRSKSDIIVEIEHSGKRELFGVGVKTCFNPKPTNAQLYFGTAVSFCALLRRNQMEVTQDMEDSLRMFCGDVGFRPEDSPSSLDGRISDPSRWYWEELPQKGRSEWEGLLEEYGDEVTRILLQKAYADDPIDPKYLLHLRNKFEAIDFSPLAIYSIDEFVQYSKGHGGFSTQSYVIRKGSFKHDDNEHLAPRFGVVQFQRGGQKQHPTQLQFNLKAGYFNTFPSSLA